ncbi:hypothetical protein B0H66DRAFT_553020 [Apodospora peruviana]|uniref:Secreted protein n=1 Tax=Apodospora peruviana TaxID=516989 RepID=A0AAE0IBP0_9PEZI|nr:hypothetical protein B0H66DRAFT_553020 [Apodospora peruviana]
MMVISLYLNFCLDCVLAVKSKYSTDGFRTRPGFRTWFLNSAPFSKTPVCFAYCPSLRGGCLFPSAVLGTAPVR